MRKQCNLLLSALLAVCLVFSFPIEKAEAKSNGVLVVAVDPGHGGGEAGAHANGVNEEEANWDIAVACVNELNTYSGVKAVFDQVERSVHEPRGTYRFCGQSRCGYSR